MVPAILRQERDLIRHLLQNMSNLSIFIFLNSQPNKVKYCLKVGQLDMAADLAAAAKNTDDLLLVMQSCGPGDAALVEKIRLLRAQLLERNR